MNKIQSDREQMVKERELWIQEQEKIKLIADQQMHAKQDELEKEKQKWEVQCQEDKKNHEIA